MILKVNAGGVDGVLWRVYTGVRDYSIGVADVGNIDMNDVGCDVIGGGDRYMWVSLVRYDGSVSKFYFSTELYICDDDGDTVERVRVRKD